MARPPFSYRFAARITALITVVLVAFASGTAEPSHAAEIVHKRNGIIGVTERWPWLIAFLFGLFHGLGFAGALSEIGVPQAEVPLALLMFNVGVETGQLLFVSVVLSVIALLRRFPLMAPAGAWRVAPYTIGSLAAFWTIQRVMSFMPQ